MKIIFCIFILISFAPTCNKTPEFYYAQGKKESIETNHYVAIQLFTKAIKEKHTFTEAYYERANAYMQMDSIDSAIRDYDSLLIFTKDNQQRQGELYFLKGNANYLMSRDSLCCEQWGKARDLNCYGAWEKIRRFCK